MTAATIDRATEAIQPDEQAALEDLRAEQLPFEAAIRAHAAGTATAAQFHILQRRGLTLEQLEAERQRLILVDRLLPEAGTADQYGAAIDAEHQALAERERSLPNCDSELQRLETEAAKWRAERKRLVDGHQAAKQKREAMDAARKRLRTAAPPVIAQLHQQQSRRVSQEHGRQSERALLTKRIGTLHQNRGYADGQVRELLNNVVHNLKESRWDWIRPFLNLAGITKIDDAIHASFSNEPDSGKALAAISKQFRIWSESEYQRLRDELASEEQALASSLAETDALLDFYLD